MIGLGIARKLCGKKKDTAENILETEEFVVHLAEIGQLGNIVGSSKELSPGESEAEDLGLELVPSHAVHPPSLAAAGIRLECKLFQHQELGNGPVDHIIGEVVAFVLPSELMDSDGRVKEELFSPVGRMGGRWYASIERRVMSR
jgi:flavin reductase (DIM6/NTAB) family NADH-FMN oxidoreductase RutF